MSTLTRGAGKFRDETCGQLSLSVTAADFCEETTVSLICVQGNETELTLFKGITVAGCCDDDVVEQLQCAQ